MAGEFTVLKNEIQTCEEKTDQSLCSSHVPQWHIENLMTHDVGCKVVNLVCEIEITFFISIIMQPAQRSATQLDSSSQFFILISWHCNICPLGGAVAPGVWKGSPDAETWLIALTWSNYWLLHHMCSTLHLYFLWPCVTGFKHIRTSSISLPHTWGYIQGKNWKLECPWGWIFSKCPASFIYIFPIFCVYLGTK